MKLTGDETFGGPRCFDVRGEEVECDFVVCVSLIEGTCWFFRRRFRERCTRFCCTVFGGGGLL